jgi:hypothetical protein
LIRFPLNLFLAAVGEGVDAARFDPSNHLLFSSSGDGTFQVIHEDSPDKYSVIFNVLTGRGDRTMERGKKTHRIYTVTADLRPQPTEPHCPPSMAPGTISLLVFGLLDFGEGTDR